MWFIRFVVPPQYEKLLSQVLQRELFSLKKTQAFDRHLIKLNKMIKIQCICPVKVYCFSQFFRVKFSELVKIRSNYLIFVYNFLIHEFHEINVT